MCKSTSLNKCNINVQVQSAVKVGEESEVATNIQPYEIKRMSFTIKLVLQNESAFAMLHTIYLVDTRGELE